MGIVSGSGPKKQVLKLLQLGLEAQPDSWPNLTTAFENETNETYKKALTEEAPAWWKKWLDDPRAQYDHHAQVVFRLRDQDKRPILHPTQESFSYVEHPKLLLINVLVLY